MKNRNIARSLTAGCILFASLAAGAGAATVSFPTAGSTFSASGVGEGGFLFSSAHSVSDSIAIPETAVDRIQFTLSLDRNFLQNGGVVNLDFVLEGVTRFSFSFNQTHPLGLHYFDEAVVPFTIDDGFADVVLQVTNNVSGGQGSISFGYGSDNLVLTAVPEPSSMILLSVVTLGLFRRQRIHR